MKPMPEIRKEFYDLLGALREETLDERQKARLDSLLNEYPSLQGDYVDYVLLWHALRCYQPLSQEEQSRMAQRIAEGCSGPTDFWRVIEEGRGGPRESGRDPADVKAIEREAQRRLDRFLAEQEEIRRLQWVNSAPRSSVDFAEIAQQIGRRLTSLCWVVGGAAVLIVLALAVALGVQYVSKGRPVATLTETMNAKWDAEIAPGAALHTGRLRLERGYARIVFQRGADVLIEAPAELTLRSTQRMTLTSGKLLAEVPPTAKGFRVDTAQASIVDLGTQFGVKADSAQTSDLHLFKGRASLTPQASGTAATGQIVTEGQARRVDAAGQVQDIQVDKTAFVRRLFRTSGFAWRGQPIDLADVLGGGNGFATGQVGRWLDIGTGLDGTRYIINGQITQQYQTTDNRYHRVTHLPYVDGVFSPNGIAGAVQVSSQNHLWQDCPKTAGTYFEDIFNGDYIPVGENGHGLVLRGQAYGTKEHPAIVLHSNAGITFDLDAMRGDLPGLEIVEFKAICGISEDVRKHPEDPQQGKSDFWVLVDGKKRFEAAGMDANSRPQEISVPLGGHERFVTLVTTDGDERTNCDWGFFAEPRLEVRVIQQE